MADKKISVGVYRGIDQIKAAYEKIFSVSKNERVHVIQGVSSAKKQFQKIEKEYILNFHKIFKKKDIILEAISGNSILKIFYDLSQEELESHFGRLVIAYFVPDEFIDSEIDIMIFANNIMLINLEEEIVLHINSGLLATAFKNLFNLLKEKAIKKNLDAFIAELISNRNKIVVK